MEGGRLGRGSVGAGLASLVFLTAIALILAVSVPLTSSRAFAANPAPQSGSIGLEGTISSAPPKHGATITVPSGGTIFTSIPITISGLCPTNLLVKVFDNGVMVGSTVCSNGSYSLRIDLFSGRNDIVVRVYDALDQAGPDSNKITVIFNDASFLQFGTHVTLTSAYAERGAPPGTELDWPVVLNGGVGPYAISVDWGDGTAADLISESAPGTVTLKHTYKSAGVYQVIVKATDKNGGEAFLQLVGQATGAIQNNKSGGNNNNVTTQVKVVWWPLVAIVPLLLLSFWLGGRHRIKVLRRELEDDQ